MEMIEKEKDLMQNFHLELDIGDLISDIEETIDRDLSLQEKSFCETLIIIDHNEGGQFFLHTFLKLDTKELDNILRRYYKMTEKYIIIIQTKEEENIFIEEFKNFLKTVGTDRIRHILEYYTKEEIKNLEEE